MSPDTALLMATVLVGLAAGVAALAARELWLATRLSAHLARRRSLFLGEEVSYEASPPGAVRQLRSLRAWAVRVRGYAWFRAPFALYESIGTRGFQPNLRWAGLEDEFSLETLGQIRFLLTLAAVVLGALRLPDVQGALTLTLGGAVAAWVYPRMLVEEAAKARLAEIARRLPEALDVLAIGLEAGGGGGFDHVAGFYTQFFRGPLADELGRLLAAVRSGRRRVEALDELAERCPTPEMITFTSAIAQAERFGAPLGPTLRTQTDLQRTVRRQAIEERSRTLTTYLLFPTMLFLFSLLILILGPVVIQLGRSLGG
jgi:tight adherence protein C